MGLDIGKKWGMMLAKDGARCWPEIGVDVGVGWVLKLARDGS